MNPVVSWPRVIAVGLLGLLVVALVLQRAQIKYLKVTTATAEATAKSYEDTLYSFMQRTATAKQLAKESSQRVVALENANVTLEHRLAAYMAKTPRPKPPTAECPADGWLSADWLRLYNEAKGLSAGAGAVGNAGGSDAITTPSRP